MLDEFINLKNDQILTQVDSLSLQWLTNMAD